MVKSIERTWYDKEQQKSKGRQAVRTGKAEASTDTSQKACLLIDTCPNCNNFWSRCSPVHATALPAFQDCLRNMHDQNSTPNSKPV